MWGCDEGQAREESSLKAKKLGWAEANGFIDLPSSYDVLIILHNSN